MERFADKRDKELLDSIIAELRGHIRKFPDADCIDAIAYIQGMTIRPTPENICPECGRDRYTGKACK